MFNLLLQNESECTDGSVARSWWKKSVLKRNLTTRNNLTYSERCKTFLPINLQDSSPKCMVEAKSKNSVQFLAIFLITWRSMWRHLSSKCIQFYWMLPSQVCVVMKHFIHLLSSFVLLLPERKLHKLIIQSSPVLATIEKGSQLHAQLPLVSLVSLLLLMSLLFYYHYNFYFYCWYYYYYYYYNHKQRTKV